MEHIERRTRTPGPLIDRGAQLLDLRFHPPQRHRLADDDAEERADQAATERLVDHQPQQSSHHHQDPLHVFYAFYCGMQFSWDTRAQLTIDIQYSI